jgi:hypothetical protein
MPRQEIVGRGMSAASLTEEGKSAAARGMCGSAPVDERHQRWLQELPRHVGRLLDLNTRREIGRCKPATTTVNEEGTEGAVTYRGRGFGQWGWMSSRGSKKMH